jgi:hypothetical protein
MWFIEDNGYDLVLVTLEEDDVQPIPEPQQLELFEFDECY